MQMALARHLHDTMERLDPQGSDWGNLTEFDREFYRVCASHALAFVSRWSRTGDNRVVGAAEPGK
jgi:hypothetical protein